MGQDRVILTGATILPCTERTATVEALAVSDGRILCVGRLAAVRAAAGAGAREIDLAGATVIPGLIDTHPHLAHFGVFTEPLLDISDATSHAEICERIASRARETPAGEWIMTTPVGEPHYFVRRSWRDLAEGVLPGRAELDEATTRHPVFIQAWAPVTPNVCAMNSAALERLGLDGATPLEQDGVHIERDGAGELTGRLLGRVNNYYNGSNFMNSLLVQIPMLDLAAIGPGIVRAMGDYNALGVTTVYEGHAMDVPMIEAYRWLRSEDRLTVRVLCALEAEPYGLPWDIPLEDGAFQARLELARDIVTREDSLLRIDGVTISRGGPCWPGFILMREPYLDPEGHPTRGRSFVSAERAERAMRFCLEEGVRLNVVTAGVAEHDTYLDALESLQAAPLATEERAWLLQHLYFVEPEQARRFAALGFDATTSMSFSWGKGELVRERFGAKLLEDLIPLRRLLDAGLRVGCGTDWGPKNVFEHLALAAQPHYGASGATAATPGIARQEALAMWTRDAAGVLAWDDLGSLAAGYHADLAILDRDPLTCPIEELAATRVLSTILAGRTVHGEDVFG
jgi:predicted amidohydrolase YtcJ